MNTPDQGPKDGDFVAYLAELERRQLHANPSAGATRGSAASPKGAVVQAGMPSATGLPTGAVAVPAPTSISPAAALEIARSIPTGLVVIGLALVVAGLAFNGGVFLVLVGIVMLAQAVRVVLKAAANSTKVASPAQQVTALLTAHARSKTTPQK